MSKFINFRLTDVKLRLPMLNSSEALKFSGDEGANSPNSYHSLKSPEIRLYTQTACLTS